MTCYCLWLVGCSPWDLEESDTTEQLHFHFSLSCIGEGNGNLLQVSCLENPRDGGAWWAAVYGVAQSRTRLKGLSSSSSILSEIREKQILYVITYIWNLKNKTNKCSHLIFVTLFNSLNPVLLTPSHVLLMSVFLILTFTSFIFPSA